MKFSTPQGKKLIENSKKIEFKKSNSPIYSYLCIATLLFGHFLNCSVMIRNGCFVGSNCSNPTDIQSLKEELLYTININEIRYEVNSNKLFSNTESSLPIGLEINGESFAKQISKSLKKMGYRSIFIPLSEIRLVEKNSNSKRILEDDIVIMKTMGITKLLNIDIKYKLDYPSRLRNLNSNNFLYSLGIFEVSLLDFLGVWYVDLTIEGKIVDLNKVNSSDKDGFIARGVIPTTSLFFTSLSLDHDKNIDVTMLSLRRF